MDASSKRRWHHPGGKLRELGAESLSDAELLAILISTGIKGKPAEKIAEEILIRFGSFKEIAEQPLKKFLEIKGLGAVKIHRIAAALEIARRIG
jgi:DNA repair protein RadC